MKIIHLLTLLSFVIPLNLNAQSFEIWSWESERRVLSDGSPLLLGDVNGDGLDDLISFGAPGEPNAGNAFVYLSRKTYIPTSADWNFGQRLLQDKDGRIIGDVNGDGKDDLVAIGAPGATNAGWIYVNLSNGTGFPGWSWNSGGRAISDGSRVFMGDVNGDGKDDLIAIGAAGESNAGEVVLGLSNGTGFQTWSWFTGRRLVDDQSKLAIGDVNGDGKDDLIAIGAPNKQNSGKVFINFGSGSGFQYKDRWSWESAEKRIDDLSPIIIGDSNGDGLDDLISIGASNKSNAGNTFVYLSRKTYFPASADWNHGQRVVDDGVLVAMGDINGDGADDLVAIGNKANVNNGWLFLGFSNNLATGIKSVNENDFLIYPNPIRNELVINSLAINSNILIFDLNGRLLINRRTSLENETIDLSNLHNGMYTLQIRSGASVKISRFIKQ